MRHACLTPDMFINQTAFPPPFSYNWEYPGRSTLISTSQIFGMMLFFPEHDYIWTLMVIGQHCRVY